VIVEGAIFDGAGTRKAYVRFQRGRVVETGQIGTDSTRGRVRRIHGIVVPPPVNAHTHLADAIITREPPDRSLEEIVEPPDGIKFRALAETSPARKRRAIRQTLARMAHEGIAATVDFREEGLAGVHLFRAAARGIRIRGLVLGRPLRRPIDDGELEAVVRASDGIGISSAREEPPANRAKIARACHRQSKLYALHASEGVREPPEDYLVPRPDLLVHLTLATRPDLEQVAETRVPVAICPRSNALFGRRPDVALMEETGIRLLVGTDNAMFHAPSIWREIEFAYVTSRYAHRPTSANYLARAAFVEPWRWLGIPNAAEVGGDSPISPLVIRLPSEDPAYQLVTRVTEHLIMRPRPAAG
jgi:cytosine/adenosine deaminase-related metal-dependent hydrolase